MGKSDTATRMYLKDKERFADLFNVTMFDGKQSSLCNASAYYDV